LNLDDTDVRLSQFALFHSLVAETAKDDGYPIILMGDFNVDAAVHNGSSPEVRSTEGSLSYRMMMDVIKGKGTDLQLISGENNTETKLSYSDDWHLDNLTDVVYEKFGYHPVTFGDYNKLNNGTLVPAETILTHHDQLMTVQSIDRLLWLNNRDGQPVNSSMSLGNITIEKFHVKKNESSLPFTQISGKLFNIKNTKYTSNFFITYTIDHYGISALLNLK
jgi:hypothetical protein